jgi:RHS repeat-associated protein
MRALNAMVLTCAVAVPSASRSQPLPPVPVSPPSVTDFEYDAEGHLTRTVRGAGSLDLSTQYGRDSLSRVESIVDPSRATTRLRHDGGGRPLQVTDPRGLITRYERDGRGRITKIISPDTGVTEFRRDGEGNVVASIDSRAVAGRFEHDWKNRPTLAAYSRAGQIDETLRWTYDEEGPAFGFSHGQLTGTGYPAGASQYRYGPGRELISAMQRVEPSPGANPQALTLVTGYDHEMARLTGIRYPSGRELRISWGGGRIDALSLAERSGQQATPLISGVEWEPFGSAARNWVWHVANGLVPHERSFDLAGRMVRYPLGSRVRDVRYDEADRIVSFTHMARNGAPQAALDQSFGYDANSRLTRVTTATANWTFALDANGNRTGVSLNGSLSSYDIEPTSNRLTGIANPSRRFSFDSAGNTVVDSAGYEASYDLRDQMTSLTKGGVTTRYDYNAAGQRIRKYGTSGTSSTVVFVYDPDGHLLGEYDAAGSPIREYVWLRDMPVAMFTPDPANPAGSPLVYFIHTDHLDAPRVVMDMNGAIRWQWVSEPFGTTAPEVDPSGLGVFTFNLRFPGQYADQESGLWYNHFRHYEKDSGRYTQSDPIGLAGGSLSTYTYVAGDPLLYVDPMGLETCVLVTRMTGGFADHAALYFSRGSDSGGPAIYDPAGSYARSLDPGNGDMITGKAADMGKFAEFYKRLDGTSTDKTCKDTPEEEERRLFERAMELGGQAGLSCSRASSSVLSGSPYYRSVAPGTFFPGNLFRDAKKP